MRTPEASGIQDALLFIPDISGFTRFVNDTEIAHSQHIIEELLDRIIDSNEMDLKMAEVEGDAVFFYHTGIVPTAAQLLSQIQRMFINFHGHLRLYEAHRICQCGACSSANALSLKFFCHYGEVSVNQVKGTLKPFGPNVILIHRLMKNEIQGGEYALFTDALIQASANWVNIEDVAWAPPVEGQQTYDAGEVQFQYIPLASLKQHVSQPSPTDFGLAGASDKVLSCETVVEAPMNLVFDVISDLDYRHHWFIGLKGSDKLNHKIMQSGSTHRCVIKQKESDPFFVAHDFNVSNDLVTFVETNHKDGHASVYYLRRLGKALTKVEVTYIAKPNPIKKLIFNLLIKKKLEKITADQLGNLNNYCKKLVAEGKQHPNHIELGINDSQVF